MLFCVVFRVQLLVCPEDGKQQFLRNEPPDYTTSRHRRQHYLESIYFDERNISVTCIFLWCFSLHFSSHETFFCGGGAIFDTQQQHLWWRFLFSLSVSLPLTYIYLGDWQRVGVLCVKCPPLPGKRRPFAVIWLPVLQSPGLGTLYTCISTLRSDT